MLGLELEEARAIAVRVDTRGEVQARATVDVQSDLATAATAALAEVTGAASDEHVLGIAAFNPESPSVTAVVAGLAHRFAGPFVQTGATPTGTAAAVAETSTVRNNRMRARRPRNMRHLAFRCRRRRATRQAANDGMSR